MITYQKELFAAIMAELPEILYEHSHEVSPDDLIDPDWMTYVRMEAAGALHLITARDGKKLVGYFFAIVQPRLHHKKQITAYIDLIYLLPEYRGGTAGVRLVKEGEKMLKALKVHRSHMAIPEGLDINILPLRLGYTMTEKLYAKVL